MDKDKLKKIITKASSLEKNKEIGLAKEFIALDEKIDENIGKLEKGVNDIRVSVDQKLADISEELKKKLESELVLEINKEELKGDKGEDGKDYILTDKDKKQIAKSIKVNKIFNVPSFKDKPKISQKGDIMIVEDTNELYIYE